MSYVIINTREEIGEFSEQVLSDHLAQNCFISILEVIVVYTIPITFNIPQKCMTSLNPITHL